MLTVACVRTGTKYGPEYVYRLKSNVAKHLLDHRHRFVCLTDRPGDLADIDTIDVGTKLPGWWAKMGLFSPIWREGRALYIDLDTIPVGDLGPLAGVNAPFGICENFTRLAGYRDWPCRYGSCVMTFGQGWGEHIWEEFKSNAASLMARCGPHGDQMAIEQLVAPGEVTLLQRVMPPGFFVGYRELPKHKAAPPKSCSVVVFAGSHKPHNTDCAWARQAWAA